MSLVFDEPRVAVRNGISNVVADRNRDILVLSSVPQVNPLLRLRTFWT